jgi:uncharacterized protein YhbP (UPF0306 family)
MEHNWKKLLSDCLHGEKFMALATHGPDGLWNNPVYYAWDDEFHLYFISELDCRHMRNIQKSDIVSCTIFPTSQFDGDVFGSYIRGRAELIDKNHPDWKIADKIYYDRVFPNDSNWEQRTSPDCYRQKENWHLVRITPSEISYFDTRYFDEVRVLVPQELYS